MGYLSNSGVTKLVSYLREKIDTIIAKNKNVFYGTCVTAAATAAKVVVCKEFTADKLVAGTVIYVKFTNACTYNGVSTLNINSTGARDIARVGTTKTIRYYWSAGEVIAFTYDGTYWVMEGRGTASTTYYGLTKLSSSTSSTSTALAATPSAVKAAYDLADGKQDALVSGTNIKTVNGNSLLGSGNLEIGGSGGVSVSSQIICLYSGGWSVTNEYRKSVSGVTPSSDVLVSYYPTSKGTYETISLYCKSQGEGVLTFAANTTPSSDIYVSILIIDGGEKITALLYNEEISGSAWWQENEPDGTEPNVIESANAGSTVYIFSMVQTITVNVTTVSGTTAVTLSDWGDDPDYGGYYTAFTIPQDAQICTIVL